MSADFSALIAKLDAYVCLLPGCSQEDHSYDTCVAPLPDVDLDDEASLATEFLSESGGAPRIVTFVFDGGRSDNRREMRDRASAAEFTAQLRRLADAIDGASAFLPA